MIQRTTYLKQLKIYQNKPFIKVLTGLRRVGKSVLLDQYVEELLSQGIPQKQILKLNFEMPVNFSIVTYEDLVERVLSWAGDQTGPLYLLLDEVGRVEHWEKAINGFYAMNRFDMVITGSNADLLSSELSTYLAGRTIEMVIFPLSYREFIELHPKASFMDYITFGGIPSISAFELNYEPSMNALRDSFCSAVLQDVITRHQLRNSVVLERLVQYLFANTSKTFSALSISNYLKSQRINVSVDTILNYLKLLTDAFLIYKASRYDVPGKSILKTEEKYFIADHGYREALVGNNQASIELVLGNIVYMELIRRGFQVYIGKINQLEVDFVATKGNQRIYYQVAYLMPTDATRLREFSALSAINDLYPKVVLSMDPVDFSQNGIQHLTIEAFLTQ